MSYRTLGYKAGRTRLLPQLPNLAATTVQVGFYTDLDEPLGEFGALLYLQLEESIDGLLAELEGFFRKKRNRIGHNEGTTAARLVWHLLQEANFQNVGIHQSLKADINYFVKISLAGKGQLALYEIPCQLATAYHPTKGLVVWAQPERDPAAWSRQSKPENWQLIRHSAFFWHGR